MASLIDPSLHDLSIAEMVVASGGADILTATCAATPGLFEEPGLWRRDDGTDARDHLGLRGE